MKKLRLIPVTVSALLLSCSAILTSIGSETDAPPNQTSARTSADGDKISATDQTPQDDGTFIVHEWGTFTTFSGSDGLFLDFRPLAQEHSDLPNFVFDRATGYPQFSKARIRGRVRMETPVTYFYTDRFRSVNARVDFPKGLLTEFYPPARKMLPRFDPKAAFSLGEAIGNSSLDWGRIDLIPPSSLVNDIPNATLRRQLQTRIVNSLLPRGPNDEHYAAARATDSALVHFRGRRPHGLATRPEQSFLEKFLFYRGVGKFDLPYQAAFAGSDLRLTNHAAETLSSAILIDNSQNTLKVAVVNEIAAGESISFHSRQKVSVAELSKLVEQQLVNEGLYAKEAASMVATWNKSWFAEPGIRVLYMVPARITDEILPLHIDPAPQEMLRVLVGRMEIMSPAFERQVATVVSKSATARHAFHKAQSGKKKRAAYPLPGEILEMGRLTEPALARIANIARNPQTRGEARLLLTQLQRHSEHQEQAKAAATAQLQR